MQRAVLWFKCAAMHDPVRPVLKQPAVIGWEAKQRQVDLVIERPFSGSELLRRMKGWVTVDVESAIELAEKYGRLKVLDDYDLVVEVPDDRSLEALSADYREIFGGEAWLEPVAKQRLT